MFVRIKSWGISHSLPSLSFRFKLRSCLYSVCEIHPLIRGDNPITQQSLEYSTGRPQSKYLAIGIFLGVSLRCINQINLILLFLCCTSVFFTLYLLRSKRSLILWRYLFHWKMSFWPVHWLKLNLCLLNSLQARLVWKISHEICVLSRIVLHKVSCTTFFFSKN